MLVLPMAPDTYKSSGLTGGDAMNSDKESPNRAISQVVATQAVSLGRGLS